MKKILLSAVAIFLFVGVSNAQFRFGIKAGATMNDFSTESSVIDNVKGATNYQFGLLFQARAKGFAIQPEILYSVRSAELDNVSLGTLIDGNIDYKTQNIDVPVNLQLGFGSRFARIFVQAGPWVSFQTSALINQSKEHYDTLNEFLDFNEVKYGVGVGAGVELLNFQLAVKYDYAMNTVGKDVEFEGLTSPFKDLKSRTLNISLAMLF